MRGLLRIVGILGLCLLSATGQAHETELDKDQAAQQCQQGVTIYCIALGMAEEKEHHPEQAMIHYRRACRSHPSGGHLRACTPMLALARELGRLDAEAEFLETKCRAGDTVTCFYLGKEYLKITETERAAHHLAPLCRDGYRPPDPKDYGPCFHMARAFQQTHQFDRARELYEIDCQRQSQAGGPSCEALRNLNLIQNLAQQHALDRVRGLGPKEGILIFLVMMAFLDAGVWFWGGPWKEFFVCVAAPMVVLVGWLVWELWPQHQESPLTGRIVILFSVLLVLGLAALVQQSSLDEAERKAKDQKPQS